MSDRALREAIESLRAEIRTLDPGDTDAKARLDVLVSDLERRLESPGDAEQDESLSQGLREAIEHFEIEHPRTTSLLNHIMVTLGNMGI